MKITKALKEMLPEILKMVDRGVFDDNYDSIFKDSIVVTSGEKLSLDCAITVLQFMKEEIENKQSRNRVYMPTEMPSWFYESYKDMLKDDLKKRVYDLAEKTKTMDKIEVDVVSENIQEKLQ